MFDKSHFVVNEVYNPKGALERFLYMKGILDQKCAANLRLLATKNNINRASDYHYLTLAVTQSTEPVNGIDYIHPVVKPNVDYATAVISKGLLQNGEINFEFIPDNEADATAARQATDMVHKIVNQNNDPHKILQHWIMDSLLHKNGEMLISPYREQITRYVKTSGTADQLQAFEAQAADAGLTATRTSKRRVKVDLEKVKLEMAQYKKFAQRQEQSQFLEGIITHLNDVENPEGFQAENTPNEELFDSETQAAKDAIARNSIYDAEYKLVGYNMNIKFRPIAQHYWMCNPTIIDKHGKQ